MSIQMEELTLKQYFTNIRDVIRTTVKGMGITFKYVWGVKEVTIQYPEEREVLPARARMRLFNDVDNCIACTQCALACPVSCIYLASERRPAGEELKKATDGSLIRLRLTQYTIDTALCCSCGLCTVVCPTECLTHTKDYEYSSYIVDALKYDYLAPDIRAWKQRIAR